MSAELRNLIEAKAARIHWLSGAQTDAGVARLSQETAELQAMIAEAAREERIERLADPLPSRFAQA